jgi:copper chaperone CopZ
VTGALQGVAGVAEAKVDLAANAATVKGDGVDPAALVAAVEEEGYEAVPA